MPNTTAVTVPAPVRQPHKFGLFSQLAFHNVTDPHQLMGIQWEPDSCTRPTTLPDQCPCPTQGEYAPPAPVQDAEAFNVLGSWSCALGGFTPDYAQTKARDNLAAGEQQAVEWAIWTGDTDHYAPLPDDSPQRFHGPRFADPTTPVIGEVSCAKDAMALIEQYTASRYVGAPIIHVPRPALAYLAQENQVAPSGTRLETVWGTPVVAGAGYAEANTGPDGTKAPVGSWWMYVTGAFNAYRSDVFTPPEASAGFVRCNNEMLAVAMRTYLLGWDCLTAAVLFTPCCDCGQPTGVIQ